MMRTNSLFKTPSMKPLLPVDIILHIFHVGTFDSPDIEDRMTFPLHVSQVNRSWRALALQTSRLWSFIIYQGHPKFIIIPLSREKIKPSHYYPLINLFLERSRTRPLTIHLDLRHHNHNYTVREVDFTGPGHPVDPLLHVLTPHGTRFQNFTFIANTWTDVVQLICYHICSLHMPLLNSFKLTRAYLSQTFRQNFEPRSLLGRVPFCVKPDGGVEHAESLCTITQSKWPNVEHVTLNGIPLEWRLWCFTNLTSLTINYLAEEARPSTLDLRNVLKSNAHCLESLEIHGASPDESDKSILHQIELPQLRELSVGYSHCHDAMWLIRSLNTPSLTSLEICDVWQCYRQFCEHTEKQTFSARRILSRDASELFGLILEHVPFPLDKIQYLSLRYVSLCDDGQNSLIDITTDDTFFPAAAHLLMSMPALDTLILECTDFEPLAFHLFRNPTRPPKHPLPRLQIVSCEPWRNGYESSSMRVQNRTSHHGDVELDQTVQSNDMATSS